jgi:aryl-alcohol dehydrogenase-like predicted oxidoreductase
MASVAPMGTGADYAADVDGAHLFESLVRAGYVGGLIEAAMRFAITTDAISTALVGLANIEQLEIAAAAVNRGPLTAAALAELPAIWERLAAR